MVSPVRWIWHHSVVEADFTSWAPGYPHNSSTADDCAILSSDEGYSWADVR